VNLLYLGSTRTGQKTPLQVYHWKQCLTFSCPATSYNDVFTIVAPIHFLATMTLLYCCTSEHAYRAIAWQWFGQIRHNIITLSDG
jgi:hypothetical protein